MANTVVYLMNKYTTSGVHDVTQHEKFSRKTPDLSHVKIFCLIVYVHVPNEKRQKLDLKSEKCILVGYSLEQKGYKCYNPSTKSSSKSTCHFRLVSIMVRNRDNYDFFLNSFGIGRARDRRRRSTQALLGIRSLRLRSGNWTGWIQKVSGRIQCEPDPRTYL